MSFISYAQNFEDVMLWRALKHVHKGFYIDVGAAWPEEHSVTKAFYDQGWTGINIEPNPTFYQQLVEKRPLDINLKLALGNKIGNFLFFFINNTGLSTAVESIANEHLEKGFANEHQQTKITKLERVYEQYVSPEAEVHFLKIDVEGMEKAVLKGNNWTKYRPWIILIESTLPLTQFECHDEWESILLLSGYRFIYADGLNRFYLAQEHEELASKFQYPPNIFDGYIQLNHKLAEVKAHEAEAKAHEAEAKAHEAEAKANHFEAMSNQQLIQIQELYSSRSWRITRSLRWVGEQRKKMYPKNIKKKLKLFLQHSSLYIDRRSMLKRAILVVLNRFPTTKQHLSLIKPKLDIAMLNLIPLENKARLKTVNEEELIQLTPRAREIYINLKETIERNQKGAS